MKIQRILDEKEPLNSVGIGYSAIKKYLDELGESGCINIFGATNYLQRKFKFLEKEAKVELTRWTGLFGKRG